MRAHKRLGVVAAVAAGTVVLAACSSGSQPKAGAAPVRVSPTAGQSTAGAPPVDPSRPIGLDLPGKVLLQVAGRTGSAQPAVVPRVEPGTLSVEVECTGPGKITVRLGAVMWFDVDCAPGTPGTHNEIVLDNALTDVAVSVHGAAADTWALALGWSDVRQKPR
ncbi:hypothetical protein [Streptacidiphilus jiangxiensis]|uniref:Lipoprotein n=1 Tax=Streptacidiphilus jiangxiensis TaxID=235985 RepID=A0A1H7Y2C6_STRJI|nr:hypothetical protein [Streptacidiphilus jiangxiensis]SEM40111.1 hypothetical protein SAMN05414137_12669 [Streptacidiphilus jiangxiensis]